MNLSRKLRRGLPRRDFMKWSAASLSALGFGGAPVFLRRAVAGGGLSPNKKVLFIFLRGGIDAVQAIIPYGDQGIAGQAMTYEEARPRLRPNRDATHDLNGFASLYPTMQEGSSSSPKLADIFHGNVDERGPSLALLHRVGYERQNRSHFSSQQFWENALPGDVALEEGWLNRYLTQYPPSGPMPAAMLNTGQAVLLKGETLVPVLRSIDDYALPGNVSIGLPPSLGDPFGAGLRGAYGQTDFDAEIPFETLTYSTGSTLLENLQFFEDTVRQTPYEPEPDAVPHYNAITDTRFRGYVRDCARLLKQVDGLQVVGCNQGNYDTHGNEAGRFPGLVRNLANALTALYHDLKPIWDDTIVFTMSEFGRTSLENANRGTDHGESGCMMCMGGPVKGGVYNCDAGTWANGDLFSTPNGRYVAHRTDFRSVYAEILTRHLGDPSGKLDAILPGYGALKAADTAGYFDSLGFL